MRLCLICGWQDARQRGRCNACRLFLMRHGRDKTPVEVMKGYERAMDKAFDLKDWRLGTQAQDRGQP